MIPVIYDGKLSVNLRFMFSFLLIFLAHGTVITTELLDLELNARFMYILGRLYYNLEALFVEYTS